MAETPREPDRYDKQAAEIFASGDWRFHERVAAALRAEHDAALDEAAQIADRYRHGTATLIAERIRALASPAAAPAAEEAKAGFCSACRNDDHDKCVMIGLHGLCDCPCQVASPSKPVAPAPDVRAAWTAMKMVDDAYWGDFCGCCGVILSLESQDEECGPQHTAVQLVHEWLEKHPEQPR